MKLVKLAAVVLFSFAVTACFHIQLKGSVGGGVISISALRDPGSSLGSASSLAPDEAIGLWGQEAWDEMSPLIRLAIVGIATLVPEGIDPESLYVVTATGGEDFDPELQLGLSGEPAAVQASWHAIVSGQRILDGNLKVSALTEALYQQVLPRIDEWSDAQIQARLNAAAELVVSDVDENGTVDYDDVLRWNRTFDGAAFLGDLSSIDALSEAVTAGQPASMLGEKAKQVLGSHTVVLEFDAGTVTVETLNWEAPITAANFLGYVRQGFYDQMLVHRAINGFMIQMGWVEHLGLDTGGLIDWALKTPGAPIVNESSNKVLNNRGTLSMARTSNPDSATSQFFINQIDNTFLNNGSAQNPDGYAVFARVLSGMDVVDSIARERTASVAGIGADVPIRGVLLESVTLQ